MKGGGVGNPCGCAGAPVCQRGRFAQIAWTSLHTSGSKRHLIGASIKTAPKRVEPGFAGAPRCAIGTGRGAAVDGSDNVVCGRWLGFSPGVVRPLRLQRRRSAKGPRKTLAVQRD